LSYTERSRHCYGGTIKRAKRVQAKRSSWAKHIDSKLKAPTEMGHLFIASRYVTDTEVTTMYNEGLQNLQGVNINFAPT
jgi:hypothetical protein